MTLAAMSRLFNSSGRERAAMGLAYPASVESACSLARQADISAGDLVAAEQTVELSPRVQPRGWQLWHKDRGKWEELRGSVQLRGSGREFIILGFTSATG